MGREKGRMGGSATQRHQKVPTGYAVRPLNDHDRTQLVRLYTTHMATVRDRSVSNMVRQPRATLLWGMILPLVALAGYWVASQFPPTVRFAWSCGVLVAGMVTMMVYAGVWWFVRNGFKAVVNDCVHEELLRIHHFYHLTLDAQASVIHQPEADAPQEEPEDMYETDKATLMQHDASGPVDKLVYKPTTPCNIWIIHTLDEPEKVVGFLCLFYQPPQNPSAIKNASINHLIIDPKHRRKGLATHVFQQAIQWCKQHDIRRLYALNVNNAAREGCLALDAWGFELVRRKAIFEGVEWYAFSKTI